MKTCCAAAQMREVLANLGFGTQPVDAIPSMRTSLGQPELMGTLPDRFREIWSTQAHARDRISSVAYVTRRRGS